MGIGFACDVCASAISVYTYYKNKNLDTKNSIPLLVTIIVAIIIGSYVGSLFPAQIMGNVMHFVMIAIGILFFFKKPIEIKTNVTSLSNGKKFVKIGICGSVVGFICGFLGIGGGVMICMVLTSVLGYEMHMVIGTSIFIMTFTALAGFKRWLTNNEFTSCDKVKIATEEFKKDNNPMEFFFDDIEDTGVDDSLFEKTTKDVYTRRKFYGK